MLTASILLNIALVFAVGLLLKLNFVSKQKEKKQKSNLSLAILKTTVPDSKKGLLGLKKKP